MKTAADCSFSGEIAREGGRLDVAGIGGGGIELEKDDGGRTVVRAPSLTGETRLRVVGVGEMTERGLSTGLGVSLDGDAIRSEMAGVIELEDGGLCNKLGFLVLVGGEATDLLTVAGDAGKVDAFELVLGGVDGPDRTLGGL